MRHMTFKAPWKDGKSESAEWPLPRNKGWHFLFNGKGHGLELITDEEGERQRYVLLNRELAAELRDRLTAWLDSGSLMLPGESANLPLPPELDSD